ncbi:MAG: tetratricopeptide repeat protein, partial [Verrucomicrobiota bacterium]|nr:tetratricopeptide repeat protein [Verrucomicrobiota bacterium]
SVEAVKWYRKAAEQGNASAQFNLGLKYAKGEGVPKDEIEGLAWFILAAVSGEKKAVGNRNSMEHRLGREVTLLAQQRSKEILKIIEGNKVKKQDE